MKSTTAGRAGKGSSKTPAPAAKKKANKRTTKGAKSREEPPAVVSRSAPSSEPVRAVVMIPIREIRPDPTQPRKHFAVDHIVSTLIVKDGKAVEKHGINDPITVRPVGGVTPYEILVGECRWRAANEAGLTHIPCMIDARDLTPDEVLERQLQENVARQNLSPLEVCDALVQLATLAKRAGGARRKLTMEDLAHRVGLPSVRIAQRYIALARLAPEVRTALEDDTIGIGAALELAGLADHADQVKALPEVVGEDLRTVRMVIANHYHLRIVTGCGFDPTDEMLPGGACETCPANTAAQRALWSDDADDDARCTKRACFVEKKRLTASYIIAAATAKGARELTPDQAKELFPHAWSTVPHNADVLDMNAPAYVDSNKAKEEGRPIRTWSEMVEGAVGPELVTTAPNGTVHMLVSRETLAAALRNRGLGEEADEVFGDDEETEQESENKRNTWKEKSTAMNAGTFTVVAQVIEAASHLDPLIVWRSLAMYFIDDDRGEYNNDAYERIAARRWLKMVKGDPFTPLVAWLDGERTVGEIVALVVEMMVERLTKPGPMSKLRNSPLVLLCERFGVDALAAYREAYTTAGIDVSELDESAVESEEAGNVGEDDDDPDAGNYMGPPAEELV